MTHAEEAHDFCCMNIALTMFLNLMEASRMTGNQTHICSLTLKLLHNKVSQEQSHSQLLIMGTWVNVTVDIPALHVFKSSLIR